MLYRLEGIVIRSMDYGESNKIITLCTESHGKIGVLVKGAKKLKSRHAALTQLFTDAEYLFYRQGTGLGNLNQGEILESHHLLREDLNLTAYASYACELLDRTLQDEEVGSFWFHQLKACLEALSSGKDIQITIHLFELKVLQAAGYAPVFESCVSCSRDEVTEMISPRLGGALCPRCKHLDPAAIRVSAGTLKLLQLLVKIDLRRLGNISVKDTTKAEMKTIMRAFMDMQLGHNLKSQRFIDQLDQFKA
ncbi:DNA repair protein RecO (recombination protein O) [Paenibacillus shirakamiensis]|uniref:DNA repair protein RecO n=1 Tax=Paenibacillus shirakamiensis TaxID=1265935 RepID=A0ABS4JBT0_9BACL|nr:DNA repair protein RecO [Paenibacillus shirakamiensis]MBP1999174.1 DNA repair protein RecO (recombination protein O) [Paenibacillus shirakamiensis]